ncbi:phosphatase PAP2 family protein [Patescibacteria group bacterium]|nr:phosphatase PAP2 family protein [Patescibacteria group bacterium]
MNRLILDPNLNWLVTFIASFLIWILIFGFITYFFLKKKIKKEVVYRVILSTFLAWLISELLKKIIPSIRPFKINGYPPLTITVPLGGSFPSSHTSSAFALAISIIIYNPELGFAFLLGALTVAAGRIFANVHYFIDILGGAFLGGLVAFLIHRFFPIKKK